MSESNLNIEAYEDSLFDELFDLADALQFALDDDTVDLQTSLAGIWDELVESGRFDDDYIRASLSESGLPDFFIDSTLNCVNEICR